MTVPTVAVAHAAATNGATTGTLAHLVHYGIIGIALLAVAALGITHLREAHRRRAALPPVGTRPPMGGSSERLVIPLALVSSAAASGVHAGMSLPHFQEGVLLGLSFLLVAALQLGWAVLLLTRRSSLFLAAGALGNLTVVAVWVLSRTRGLPVGPLAEPAPVGVWDLACGGWELAVVVACCVLLRDSSRSRAHVVSWREWRRPVRVYTGGSVLLMTALVAGTAL